jgi:hypothetical protein
MDSKASLTTSVYFGLKLLAHRRKRPKTGIGCYGLFPLPACVPAPIARFIAFELGWVPALGRGLLANPWRRSVIAVLRVE